MVGGFVAWAQAQICLPSNTSLSLDAWILVQKKDSAYTYLKTSLDMQTHKSDLACDRHTFLFQGLFYFSFFFLKKSPNL